MKNIEEKNSFILYNSFYEPIKALKNEQLGKLLRAIFNYTINGEITQDSDILVAFMFIKNQLDMDNKKWVEEKVKRSEAGKKGMASRWNNKNNNVINDITNDNNVINDITKITDNVDVDVNVNDNVDVNVSTTSIYDFIQQNFGRTINPIECELIGTWQDNELTRYAIKQAIFNGKYNLKYINSILLNYEKNSITTVQQAQEEEERFKNKKSIKKNSNELLYEQMSEWVKKGDEQDNDKK